MGSVLQGNANEVVVQIMIMRIATDARQIMLSQEFSECNGFFLWRLVHELRIFVADLLCNTI